MTQSIDVKQLAERITEKLTNTGWLINTVNSQGIVARYIADELSRALASEQTAPAEGGEA